MLLLPLCKPTLTMIKVKCTCFFLQSNTTMKAFRLAIFVFMILKIEAAWKNSWDKPLNFQCSSDKLSIYHIVSEHSNSKEDRRFDFNCRQVPSDAGLISWSWSGTDFCLYTIRLACFILSATWMLIYTYKIQIKKTF